ncbi:MAG: hypothetical protein Q8O24_07865 [Gallionellaceae bacterium]|nr:hypothetical protein [Gallionellaceae bacterium]
MLDLPLEPTDDLAKPAFTDQASCEAWLQQLQLTNLHRAHGVLRTELDELNRFPMTGTDRLRTLEALRETVVVIQGDYVKKIIAKKLPFSDDELTILVAIVELWQSLVTGYQRCLQSYIAGDNRLAEYAPLLTHRCLRYTSLQIFEHLRSCYEFHGGLWHQLHSLFAYAEEQGFHLLPIVDELHAATHPTSCQSVYIKTLLNCQARPAELSRGQLQLLDKWLTQWSDVVTLDRRYNVSKDEAPPLAVDLSGTQGAQSIMVSTPSDSMRYLAMMPLSKLLRVKTILLQQGQSPQQLELGKECSSLDCLSFLNKLHHYFCEASGERQIERHPVAQTSALCFSIEGIYAHIAQKPFKQAKKGADSDSLARKQIATFGRVLSDTNRHVVTQFGVELETWQIENESILGARVLREDKEGERIGVHQIVAVKPSDANAFMLGKVTWLTVTHEGQLRMGIQYLPGVAQALSIKGKGINTALSEKSNAALLLPEMPSLNIPASLIVPRDFFSANKLAEITYLEGNIQTIEMGFSVDQGADFERISFASI